MASTGETWRRTALLALVVVASIECGLAARAVTQQTPQAGQLTCRDAVETFGHGRPRVAVIGDSYTAGFALSQPTQNWTHWLHGRVITDGLGGSGFTRALTPCPHATYPERAEHALASHPDVVVVQGGLNDYRASNAEIRRGAQLLIERLHTSRVVLVGPPVAPERAAAVPRVDRVLAQVAARTGVQYVSTRSWPLQFLPDDVHLTPASNRIFGRRVARAIDRAA